MAMGKMDYDLDLDDFDELGEKGVGRGDVVAFFYSGIVSFLCDGQGLPSVLGFSGWSSRCGLGCDYDIWKRNLCGADDND